MTSSRVIPATDTLGKTSPSTTSTRRVAQLTEHLAPVGETEQVNTRHTLPIDYPISRLQLDSNHHIDDIRQLKVARYWGVSTQIRDHSQITNYVKAGLAGITAGILLPAKVPGVQLTIFEKNEDVVSYLHLYFIDSN